MTASISLSDYQEIVGPGVIDELKALSDRVMRRRLQHVNSTSVGGGVAEILTRLVPLLRELGIEASWDVIKGDQAFYNVTKAIHNAVHGKGTITEQMMEIFRANQEMNLREIRLTGDVLMIHDPQPVGLIELKNEFGRNWVWRCHIDVSNPDPCVWNFLRPYVEQYDAAIFSMPDFSQQLPIPQFRIAPSIDPLSEKNRDMDPAEVEKVLEKYSIDPERPLLTQISRFDRLKDPVGVIHAYRLVKKRYASCQLVLAGGGADDDPEGAEVLKEVREAAANDPDVHILLLPPFSDLEINALVRASTVVIQKSLKEGFGLTVSEALWKGKPVVAGAVGGIRLQVIDGITGFLVHSVEGTANQISYLLRDRKLREYLGQNGHNHVKQNFLLTRHVRDYILTMLALEHPGESLVNL
jgi:trehalose synthase